MNKLYIVGLAVFAILGFHWLDGFGWSKEAIIGLLLGLMVVGFALRAWAEVIEENEQKESKERMQELELRLKYQQAQANPSPGQATLEKGGQS